MDNGSSQPFGGYIPTTYLTFFKFNDNQKNPACPPPLKGLHIRVLTKEPRVGICKHRGEELLDIYFLVLYIYSHKCLLYTIQKHLNWKTLSYCIYMRIYYKMFVFWYRGNYSTDFNILFLGEQPAAMQRDNAAGGLAAPWSSSRTSLVIWTTLLTMSTSWLTRSQLSDVTWSRPFHRFVLQLSFLNTFLSDF